jgi:hypothetical protein
MVMVKNPANSPACAFGDFACSLGSANADVLACNDRTFPYIASGIDGVKGNQIACTFPDSLGRGTCALGGSFTNVTSTAANVMAGAVFLWLRLGLRLRCVSRRRRGLGLAALAKGVLAAYGEC